MAGIDIITAARDELEESLLDLRLLVEMAEDVAGDHPPSWLSIMGRQAGRVQEAAAGYMTSVHRHAAPLLQDVARATAGGMGGVPPMGAKRSVAEAPGSRPS